MRARNLTMRCDCYRIVPELKLVFTELTSRMAVWSVYYEARRTVYGQKYNAVDVDGQMLSVLIGACTSYFSGVRR